MDLNTMASEGNKSILLTFDVEDWFQVENFKEYIPFSSWNDYELRVEKNIHLILDLLDSFSFKPKATFFVLGWIAKKLPDMVREIQKRGHEIACHGFNHDLATKLNKNEFRKDLVESKLFLEDITGAKTIGYRAPSFAINDDILKTIESAGFLYDSSYNSFSMHDRYGRITVPENTKHGDVFQAQSEFFEIPISNLSFWGTIIPLGGGGYFRLMPDFLFKLGIKKILQDTNAFVFYSHPWEFDPAQPVVKDAPASYKFRHYVNQKKTEKKLRKLIASFRECQFVTCSEYLELRKNLKGAA